MRIFVTVVIISIFACVGLSQGDPTRIHLDEATDGQLMRQLFGFNASQIGKVAAAYGTYWALGRDATDEEIKDELKRNVKAIYKRIGHRSREAAIRVPDL